MKHTSLLLILMCLAAGITKSAYGYEPYFWVTNYEVTRLGDNIRWWNGDTLEGIARTNAEFALMGTVCGTFIQHEGSGHVDSGCEHIIMGAPYYWPYDHMLDCVRNAASQQGHAYTYARQQYELVFLNSIARLYYWPVGIPRITADSVTINLNNAAGTCIFLDGMVRVWGIVQGQVTVGASKQIGIANDLRYADADPLRGTIPWDSQNMLGLVAADDIKILNTPANGRRNSGYPVGQSGLQQTDPNRTSVVVTAALYALNGSFTFEQQNDPDSGYVSDVAPDDRGTIYFVGSIVQWRRGYVHRSTLNSSGYLTQYRYDVRLQLTRPPGICQSDDNNPATTDTLDFGNVALGTTVWDTAHVYTSWPVNVGLVMATYPFYATRTEPFYTDHFAIPVRFTPPRAERFVGSLSVSLPGNFLQIVLLGHGVHAAAPPLTMDIAPNPFNSTTLIRYTLQQAGAVRLTLYDVLGRRVRDVISSSQEAGEQVVRIDASDLASGVYFARLEASGQRVMHKLMLLK